ncbi:hypothetical protein GUITHDRAFT_118659 [Guillardia theta CCMP2712]|uniref:Uncharacterized protein n=1 Tax=Guillardia theta (strain CCMP2712) TaxID=905079 RepID=L1IGQ8_GUITC|nr:hypothetical protein GUITHDRAFT_118659 [Guillardia theta CCMP2712]EKX35109.1 hypothetical protein GUITHDRAFT_118659 [Guillardia theta CCMP2712]|eukprot:XP_005822089.1 hypothetical protein GUITHDRAFT_118659 [Guillardia theta CCMP2712]
MVLQYDENVRNMLYRRSCQYTQSGLVDASVLEADLVERVKSFAKRYPNSRTAQACKAVEGCTPDAIAEAIRSTCQQARQSGFKMMMQQIEEAKKEKVETYTASAGNEAPQYRSEIASADEIPGREDFKIDGRAFAAVHQIHKLAMKAGLRSERLPKFVAVGANVIWSESEAMEGVHLTLFSEAPKIREALAVELTADSFDGV